MTEISAFLQAAAPEPAAALDVAALLQRAGRRRRRRWAVWGSGVVAVVGGMTAGSQLVPAGNGHVEVRTALPTTTAPAHPALPSVSTTTAVPASPTTAPARPAAPDHPSAAVGLPSAGPSGSTSTTQAPATSGGNAELPEDAASYDASGNAEGCFLDDDDYGPCTYVARQPAGGVSSWLRWHIRIERGAEVIELDASTHPEWCVPNGTIRPGDRVTAWKDRDPYAFGTPRGQLSVGPRAGRCP